MRKGTLSAIVFAIMMVVQLANGKPGHEIQKKSCDTVAANLGKDSCAEVPVSNELDILSDKLGVKIDSTCDTRLAETLADWLGTPYRHAGYSKNGVDCSGFVSKIYKDVYGVSLTHSARAMIYQMKEKVKKSDLKEGDILFFKIHGKRISHVGIYLKDGYFVHASLYRGIVVENLNSKYYKRAYYAAGRPDCTRTLATN